MRTKFFSFFLGLFIFGAPLQTCQAAWDSAFSNNNCCCPSERDQTKTAEDACGCGCSVTAPVPFSNDLTLPANSFLNPLLIQSGDLLISPLNQREFISGGIKNTLAGLSPNKSPASLRGPPSQSILA